MWSLWSFALLLLATVVSATSVTGNRLLIILDDLAEKSLYSNIVGELQGRGYIITFATPRSEDLSLFFLDEKLHDHLLILPSKVKALGPELTPQKLLDFVNADGNIIIGLSSTNAASTSIVGLLGELDISLPAERTGLVVDHFNYDTISASEKHDVLALDAPINVRPGLKKYFELPGGVLAFPHSVGHTLGSGPLLTPILRAPETAYLYNPKEQIDTIDPDELFASGKQLALVSAFQARNSARVTVLGSAEMIQDKWLDAKVSKLGGKKVASVNREFAKRLIGWTFQEIGVLRVDNIEHKLVGSNETNPPLYRIKNQVSYSISVSEYSWNKWAPFTLPVEDKIQLEFSMLSPFHRLDLGTKRVTSTATIFGTSFTLPDQHGIFNFKINYKRPFLTYLEEKNTVSVRHMAHDEWPRSFVISGAWPWLSGIAATATGFVAFCAIWMYSKPPTPLSSKKSQ